MKKSIDFDKLKEILTDDISEEKEVYEFTWPGKKEAIVEAFEATKNTLVPCPQESKQWNTTQNLYIEGDNLEILKLLQESYLGKVRILYLDPPYNTGNDFIYRDKFHKSIDSYDKDEGSTDVDGNCLYKNTNANGRFHSDWCSMIYPRLLLARNLLSEDGAIFISIDENEHSNLLNMMNEVFGEENYVDSIVWDKKSSAKGVPPKNMLVNVHEYIVVYQKSEKFSFIGEERNAEADGFKNPDNDPRGPWRESNIKSTSKSLEDAFTIIDPNTGRQYTNTWAFSEKSLQRMISEGRILWKDSLPKQKEFLYEMTNDRKAIKSDWGLFDPQSTTVFLKHLIPQVKFDNPKPIALMKYLISVSSKDGDIIMDLFSGSGTTAHAVMLQNAEDDGKRKFIMVQIPELVESDTEAYKAGFKNICEIGKERIRRSGDSVISEVHNQNIDDGFRVLKLASSNMKDIYYSPENYQQDILAISESNIKEDRTDLDLLFGCLLDWGLELSKPYKSEEIAGVAVHTYDKDALMACFAKNVPEEVVREIAKRQPLRAVFRDSSFGDDAARVNLGEIFKLLSPDSEVKVL